MTVKPVALVFDTEQPKNPYPSIFGTHNGTITPNVTIYNVYRLYTYSCAGTGGHSEYVAFSNATTGEEIANGTWNGYQGAGNYHYIEFNVSFSSNAPIIFREETPKTFDTTDEILIFASSKTKIKFV